MRSTSGGSVSSSFSGLARGLAAVRDLARWSEWYDSKLPTYVAAMAYAALRHDEPAGAQMAQMVGLLVLLCVYAAFGHIINDYADREADRVAGKDKLLAGWSERSAVAAVVLPAIATIGIAWARFDASTLALTAVAMVVATVYSLPPARLKERGVLGWGAAVLAQRTLPMAIVFQALDGWDVASAALTALTTLTGVRYVIIHQLQDRDDDLRAGLRTAVTERDPRRVVALLHRLFILELAGVCGTVLLMSLFVPQVGLAGIGYALTRRARPLSPVSYGALYDFHCAVLPFSLVVLLAARNPVFMPVVFVTAALLVRPLRVTFRIAFSELRAGQGPDPEERTEEAGADRETLRPIEAAGSLPAAAAGLSNGAEAGTPSSRPERAPRSAFERRETAGTAVQSQKADPYPVYARLREMAPVVRLGWPGIGSIWVVTRHREALAVFREPRFARNAPTPAVKGGETSPVTDSVRGFGRDLPELDPPDHTRLRRLVGKAFTPGLVQRFETRIAQLVDRILDRAMSRGGIELISEYASIIPSTIISELVGVPVGDVRQFRAFHYPVIANQMLGRTSPEIDAARSRFAAHLRPVIAARRKTPQEDVVTALVQVEQEGDRLSSDELIAMTYLLLTIGFITTENLIGNGILTLLRHPEQLRILRQNPDLGNGSIDELLRFEPPIELSAACFPSTDFDLSGVRIPGGVPVRVLIPSANRDPAQFASPDILDIRRNPCPHVSFGGGIHSCLGAPLARLQGRVAVTRLIERIPNLRLADPARVTWNNHPILRGLQELPLLF
jgi:cytochrome P450/4-hydroxybenzoate polyprenyltransferase